MSVVGIDFGNESGVVAVAKRGGIETIQNEVGKRKTAAIVAFMGKERIIGDSAINQFGGNYKNSVKYIKRLLGRKSNDPELKLETPFLTYQTSDQKGRVAVKVSYDDKVQEMSPEQIAAAFLTKLKHVAEDGLGTRAVDCVLGVPPYWTDPQRRALLDAAHIAGLNVLRLLNETTAIALNYGIMRDREFADQEVRNVVFIDFGSASYNTALVQFTRGKLNVLAVACDRNFGGRDFDMLLVSHWAKYIKDKYKMDVTTDAKAMLKLKNECERVKNILSANQSVRFSVEYIMNDRDVSGMMERVEFESLVAQHLLDRLFPPLRQLFENEAAKKAGITKDNIFAYEIVGGGNRMPVVKKALSDFFKRQPSQTCDSDESVARGCALQCAMLSPLVRVREYQVQDHTVLPIILSWGSVPDQVSVDSMDVSEESTVVFPAGNPIPSVKLLSFKDKTKPFQIVAKYGSGVSPGFESPIARFIISNIPAPSNPSEIPKIKVKVKLDIHSTLGLSSAQIVEELKEEPKAEAAAGEKMDVSDDGKKPQEKESDKKEPPKKKLKRTDLKVESTFYGGLDQPALSAASEREVAMANQDRVIQETSLARNSLESYCLDMRNRVADRDDLAQYVSDEDRDKFTAALQKGENWLNDEGFEAQKSEYVKYLDTLKQLGDPIVHRKAEREQRGEAVTQLRSSINRFNAWVGTKEEKYIHIDEKERKKVADKAAETDKWITNLLTQQEKVPLTHNPVLTLKEIKQKHEALEQLANAIINTPKPAPPKEEKKDEKKAENAKPEQAKPSGEQAKPAGADPKAGEAPKDGDKPKDGAKPKDGQSQGSGSGHAAGAQSPPRH